MLKFVYDNNFLLATESNANVFTRTLTTYDLGIILTLSLRFRFLLLTPVSRSHLLFYEKKNQVYGYFSA